MPKAVTFKPLTNRSTAKDGKFALPSDGFVMLVPKGEAANVLDDGTKDGKRIIQVVDDQALSAIMSKLLNRGGDMLVDNDHHSHEKDKTTDANGWLPLEADTLQNRDDGLYGDPRWSTDGLVKVEGGVLRYVSPEFASASLEPLGGNRFRVTEVTGLALTNRPGFRSLQKPLTNRDAPEGIQANATHNTMHKAALAAHLGITETELDKLDESTLKNRLSVIKDDAAKAGTLQTELTTLKNREADDFITEHDAIIPKEDAVRQSLKTTFLANRDAAKGIVNGFKSAAQPGDGLTDAQRARAAAKPLHNRETAKAPEGDAAALKNRELRAATIRNRATALCDAARAAKRSLNWDEAWAQAESETA